ncbi:MAG: hypothetical protein GEV11_03000 [Streptosporangiales bacterium]|nr:hypothetical protein [Streptosporangiales bacterium]
MILRSWRAVATPEGAGTYRAHFETAVLAELAGVPGHLGAVLLDRPGRGGLRELQVLTLWESLEAIERFAGADADRAVVQPDARAALESYDDHVEHHTVTRP